MRKKSISFQELNEYCRFEMSNHYSMSFFSKLFHYNKVIFWGAILFSLFTLLANFLKLETTPFFVWGMYSEKEEKVNSYEILEIVVNDSVRVDYSSGFTDANRFYLLSPLIFNWQILQNKGMDPQETFLRKKTGKFFRYIHPFKTYLFNDSFNQKSFQQWYSKYLEETIHLKVVKLQLNVLELVYSNKEQPELRSRVALTTWKK
jgi:hypothetical protein